MSTSRQLAAIVFTDIVGYTALMGTNEEKAFNLIKRNRAVHLQAIARLNGRLVKELGDVNRNYEKAIPWARKAVVQRSSNAYNFYFECLSI